ncbi:MAG: sulfite exporter TauE/SafE family protein [Ardenticatenaceae bacterium]|nr:sulfite exporter TauE/SafE family protein [Ardenticatenaceae bacterium]MCB8973993.1 sulfite exporter TauE/SafE family protein [Ardenticatenaceae bacterium]
MRDHIMLVVCCTSGYNPPLMIVTLIIFFAIFVQSASGFGLALVSMPLLVSVIGVGTATPLVALVGITAELFLLRRYWEALNFTAVKRLSIASIIGIPLGVYVLRTVDGRIITAILGVVVTGYALYALFGPHLPQLRQPGWAYGFGFVGGILSGAYNTSGPPVIIYGTCRRWEPAAFKGNLQAYFFINSLFTLSAHALSGNFTAVVWQNYLWALPGIGVGLLLGRWVDGRIPPEKFRQGVLVLLVLLGIRLIVG